MILLAVRYEPPPPPTWAKLIEVRQVIRQRSAQVWNERGDAWVETAKQEIMSKCKQREMHQQHSGTRCDTDSLENPVRKKLCYFLQIDEAPSIFCWWRNDSFWACHTHAQLLYYFLLPVDGRGVLWAFQQPLQPLSACPNSSEKCCWHEIQYKKETHILRKIEKWGQYKY